MLHVLATLVGGTTLHSNSTLLGHASDAQQNKAIGWQDQYIKEHGAANTYPHLCLGFVHDAYSNVGYHHDDILAKDTAKEAAEAASTHMNWKAWDSNMHESLVTRGAALFWTCCGCDSASNSSHPIKGNPYGHAVLATGDSHANSNEIGNVKIHYLINDWCNSKPAGWIVV